MGNARRLEDELRRGHEEASVDEMPTSMLNSKCIFCTTAIHVHRHPIALHFLVCRENCVANRDCSPNPPFPLHLMKCQHQCSAANSYFVPQQFMSTVTRQHYTFLCAAKTALQTKIAHPTLPFLCIFWDQWVKFFSWFSLDFRHFAAFSRNLKLRHNLLEFQ